MKRIIKLIIPVFALGIIFNTPGFVMGQVDYNEEIKELNSEIEDRKDKTKELEDRQEAFKKAIKEKQAEQASLNNQLAILDNRIAKSELDIESTEIEIDKNELEIRKVELQLQDKEEKLEKEKEHIGSIINMMQKQDDKNSLEILLLNNSFAEFLSQFKYLEDVNGEIKKSVDELYEIKEELQKEQEELEGKKESLASLRLELEENKNLLENEENNKVFLLEQTKSSEKEYQRLLAEAKKEQEDAAAEIASLEKMVRAKIAKMQGKELDFNDSGMVWPVPKNVITAYFHDPEYPYKHIFEHPAVDIRAGQGTTLKAAASGYVARAKDNGMGYSYIMLIHGDGLSTVYGHVSRIDVQEDEYVVQGQVIGASGGLPGTPGAGKLTTGPHLHFEVRLNGIPVNPLEYLP